ncbi:MAG: VPLPA-CTERM sorting domain-containing protein [Pseudomonadota bacterium]|nr:VPLPA-CTERM sorting domain-containing protein [Pseudomonadota bacterium]MEE3100548.1 VPLPA-CTERM sorting domain-containing protein [Pseudomonadota bacterium]
MIRLTRAACLAQAAGLALGLGLTATPASAIYLNYTNMTVALGPGMAPEPFVNTTTAEALSNAIDAPSADAGETHISPDTHVWINSAPLELVFTFDDDYDLSMLHFWNYYTEQYDVDNIAFTFRNAASSVVGAFDFAPDLGTSAPLTAQNYALSFPERVRSVSAVFTGTNGEVDFNNIGFTATLSPPVPAPAAGVLLVTGLGALAAARRRRRRG